MDADVPIAQRKFMEAAGFALVIVERHAGEHLAEWAGHDLYVLLNLNSDPRSMMRSILAARHEASLKPVRDAMRTLCRFSE